MRTQTGRRSAKILGDGSQAREPPKDRAPLGMSARGAERPGGHHGCRCLAWRSAMPVTRRAQGPSPSTSSPLAGPVLPGMSTGGLPSADRGETHGVESPPATPSGTVGVQDAVQDLLPPPAVRPRGSKQVLASRVPRRRCCPRWGHATPWSAHCRQGDAADATVWRVSGVAGMDHHANHCPMDDFDLTYDAALRGVPRKVRWMSWHNTGIELRPARGPVGVRLRGLSVEAPPRGTPRQRPAPYHSTRCARVRASSTLSSLCPHRT